MADEGKGREFHILEQVAELLDTLKPEQQRQAMAMLAARYGLILKDPPSATGRSGFRPKPKSTRW